MVTSGIKIPLFQYEFLKNINFLPITTIFSYLLKLISSHCHLIFSMYSISHNSVSPQNFFVKIFFKKYPLKNQGLWLVISLKFLLT